jgi:hypothetical protein
MKINLLNTLNGLKPCDDDDFDNKRKLKLGCIYSAEIKLFRNYEFFKKYHKLITITWEFLPEHIQEGLKNKDKMRESLQMTAGFSDTYFSIDKGEWLDRPKSISFESMKEEEFIELYERVKDVIFNVFKDYITEEIYIKALSDF